MQIFHTPKRTHFCRDPQAALKQSVIFQAAQSEAVGSPGKRGEEDREGSPSVLLLQTCAIPDDSRAGRAFVSSVGICYPGRGKITGK